MKKLPGLIMIALMLVSLLAGCGGPAVPATPVASSSVAAEASGTASSESTQENAGVDFTEKPYELNFLYMVAAEGSGQQAVNEAVNQLAQDKVNMKVNMIPMTFGTYMSQMSMMLASGEALDLFPSFSNNFATYIESQYIVNCADYLDNAGDILRVMGEDAKSGYIGDFLVGFSQMKERAYPAGLVVRKDIFDELGYKVSDFKVSTTDYASFQAITDLFRAVKEAHPDMTMLDGTSILGLQVLSYVDNLGDNFGVLENYGQTTTITNWYESEQYRIFCEIGRDWFQKGYSSSDIAVNTDSGEIKMKAGKTFSYITNVKPNTNIEKLAQTGYEVEIIPLSEAMKNTNAVNAVVYSIASASEDPAKAMQFLNWTYTSQAFTDLINWGIEGKDWVVNGDGMAAYPDGVDATSVSYHNDFGWIYPNQFAGHPWVGNPADIWEKYAAYNAGLMTSQAFGFTFDSRPIADEQAQLNSVLEQYQNDLAFGAIDIGQGLPAFNDALYQAGLQKVMDEKQRQLNEWLADKP